MVSENMRKRGERTTWKTEERPFIKVDALTSEKENSGPILSSNAMWLCATARSSKEISEQYRN